MPGTVELICFSPTGTSRRMAEAVAEALEPETLVRNDLTLPGNCGTVESPLDGIAIIAAPVYAGRVAGLAAERFKRFINGDGRPAILLVTYGNRAYEDALGELKDVADDLGFIPVAAAAFIGEHSFSTPEIPLAPERPDADDEDIARHFGQDVLVKLAKGKASSFPALELPGNRPFRSGTGPNGATPDTDPRICILCGDCSRSCPAGAITIADDTLSTDGTKCIRCCACTRICPVDARSFDHEKVQELRTMLKTKCATRKEPEVYL